MEGTKYDKKTCEAVASQLCREGYNARLHDLLNDGEHWQVVVDVNLNGTYLCDNPNELEASLAFRFPVHISVIDFDDEDITLLPEDDDWQSIGFGGDE